MHIKLLRRMNRMTGTPTAWEGTPATQVARTGLLQKSTAYKLPINGVSATVNYLHGLSRHAVCLAKTLFQGNTKLLSLGAKWHAREPHLAPTSLNARLGSRLWPPSRRSPPGRMLERGQRQSCHASLRALWRSTCCSGTLIPLPPLSSALHSCVLDALVMYVG